MEIVIRGGNDNENILIANSPQDFCDTILQALADKELCQKIASHGYKLVHDSYKWNSISKKLIQYLSELSK